MYTIRITCCRYTSWYHYSSLFYYILKLWCHIMWYASSLTKKEIKLKLNKTKIKYKGSSIPWHAVHTWKKEELEKTTQIRKKMWYIISHRVIDHELEPVDPHQKILCRLNTD